MERKAMESRGTESVWRPIRGAMLDRRIVTLGLGLLIPFMTSCARPPIQEFVGLAEIDELPALHQQNIREGLHALFGTSNAPRLRLPEEAEDDESAVDEAVDDQSADHGEVRRYVDVVDRLTLRHGSRIYNARCAGCHGITGDGAGPAAPYLLPRPRDYRRGIFKFTSTPYGMKPARHDLVRVIRRGAKGTSMPAFPWMADEDLDALIEYVIYLSQRGEVEYYVTMMSEEYDAEEEIDFVEFTDAIESAREAWTSAEELVVKPQSAEPEYNTESVAAGRHLFLTQGCSKCHGIDGKGQTEWLDPEFLQAQEDASETEKIAINRDAWGDPAPAADLTARLLHGGRRPIDIYRRIYTGINGTPMPAFDQVFADNPDGVWHLVHYVRHIIEGGDPMAGEAAAPPEIDEAS